ncbi:iron complex transport system ATP-binding protein [Hydrogenispora ethanolica]|jgi:iron complex transport system ATP-binding protein|uniref:Iron complex transport system ATP-binding protein n=1 Tax=Hydrogenispora ethanolica TaxID=1082276 RepID=A0A4V2QEL3_HYDET|nr:ABC transporter ATP-binding protein [Hydrogenispora ethanolica]TCL68477.1 iron complex transport system ATP-binding protein [Hydrogenispora ethanolica]
MSVLETRGLSAGYGKKVIAAAVNIAARRGQMVALLGPNGTGKTTLLATLAGLLRPLAGTVLVNGRDFASYSRLEMARQVAVVLTDRIEPGLLTAYDVVASGRYPHTDLFQRLGPADRQQIRRTMAWVSVESLTDRPFGQLSDGEKQKVLLARALVQEPQLILLDEPTGFLDPRNRMEFMSLLARLTRERGLTVLLSLHDVELALKYCQWVLLIRDGRIMAEGLAELVLTAANLRRLYGLAGTDYNELLGTWEMANDRPPELFVVGGGGSGTALYRLLTKYGYGLGSGVLHRNDLDYQAGRSMGIRLIAEEPFEPIGAAALAAARTELASAKAVLDAGFPVGSANRPNLDLIRDSLHSGKKVFSLRPAPESEGLYGAPAAAISHCGDLLELVERLNKFRDEMGE